MPYEEEGERGHRMCVSQNERDREAYSQREDASAYRGEEGRRYREREIDGRYRESSRESRGHFGRDRTEYFDSSSIIYPQLRYQ